MSDLSRALRDMQATGSADAGPPPLDTILARRRRRRTVRRAATGATSAAAVTALVVSGAALLDRTEPAPPADPLTGMTEATWLGPDLPACGAEVPTDDRAGSWLVGVDGPVELPADEPFQVAARLAAAPGEHVAIGGAHRGTAVVLVDDGVVVARGVSDGPERAVEATTDATTDVTDDVELVACGDEPLEPGTYDAWAALELRWEWGRDAEGRTAVADSTFGWVGVPVEAAVVGDEPDVEQVVLPTGDPSLTFGECAAVVDAALPHPVVPGDVATFTAPLDPLPRGSHLPVATDLSTSPGTVMAGEASGPLLVVVADGVVVARTPLHPTGAGTWTTFLAGSEHTGLVPLTVCDATGQDDVSGGSPLPVGTYEAYVLGEVWELGGEGDPGTPDIGPEVDRSVLEGATPRSLRSDPVTLEIVAGEPTGLPDALPAAVPGPGPGFTCGEPVEPWDADGLLTLETPAEAVTASFDPEAQTPGVQVDLPATLTYRGEGVLYGLITQIVGYLVTQDGVLVGTGYPWGTDGWADHTHLGSGAPLLLEGGFQLRLCQPDHDEFSQFTDPMPPGTYQLHPFYSGDDGTWVTRPDGTRVLDEDDWVVTRGSANDQHLVVVGAPVELTVTPAPDGSTSPWSAVAANELPGEVPLVEGRVLRAETEERSGRWRATVDAESGRSTADDARAALVGAGFDLVEEQTDEDRPFWWNGLFTGEGWVVTVDVSNETGGGFLVDYEISPES